MTLSDWNRTSDIVVIVSEKNLLLFSEFVVMDHRADLSVNGLSSRKQKHHVVW